MSTLNNFTTRKSLNINKFKRLTLTKLDTILDTKKLFVFKLVFIIDK